MDESEHTESNIYFFVFVFFCKIGIVGMIHFSKRCLFTLRPTNALLNFFPLGLTCGPVNKQVLCPMNNFDGSSNRLEKIVPGVKDPNLRPREQLKLYCEHCRFEWQHDILRVRCVADPEAHNQREVGLHPTWMWGKQQPYRYYDYMPVNIHPRTRMFLAREDAKGMNNERRGQGLTTRTRNIEEERRGIAWRKCGIGMTQKQWKTHFPYPC